MEVIVSHTNLDFDALASMIAAKKLYPDAMLVLNDKQIPPVEGFLAIYRDMFDFYKAKDISWEDVTHLIIVDTASPNRIGSFLKECNEPYITVFDHHPSKEGDIKGDTSVLEQTGAAVTLLLEEIQRQEVSITDFEATLFGLGLYTDTGSLSYSTTTIRDMKTAVYLMEQGLNLELVNRFSEQGLSYDQQELLHELLSNGKEYHFQGLTMMVTWHEQENFVGGLSTVVTKLLQTTGTDAVFAVSKMGNKAFIVARSSTSRIDVLPLINRFGGGGHEKAASASVKNPELKSLRDDLVSNLNITVKPAITADVMMSSPVKSIPPDMKVEEVKQMMFRFGHTGFPVMGENDKLIGIISRRDIDKATHHGLGHAPVKGYMSTNPLSIGPKTTLEEIQEIMIRHNVGRLPVVDDEKVVGIVSRTNVIEVLHSKELQHALEEERNLAKEMNDHLPEEIFDFLEEVSHLADALELKVYMIGGIVRDLIMGRPNYDVDIVVEGNGISFAEKLSSQVKGELKKHESFGTAVITLPKGFKIDITSSRTEYYNFPGALPEVQLSNLKEDLYRRDFTINAMAIELNEGNFGQLIDFYNGLEDIKNKRLKVLHNLSFIEDPTRILRGIRFEIRFGFRFDVETEKFARHSVSAVSSLSKDRIANEIKILLRQVNPVQAVPRLKELDVLKHFLPGADCTEETKALLHTIEFCFKEYKKLLSAQNKWFMCLMALFSADKENLLRAQTYAANRHYNQILEEAVTLLEKETRFSPYSLGEIHDEFFSFTNDALFFAYSFFTVKEKKISSELIKEYIIKRSSLPKLLDGNDLKGLGLQPGPLFRDLLFQAEKAYFDGFITNKSEALSYAKELSRRK
ncbi:CBS domain-containing protein [Thalassorhabdus alkalitolerans]|uniref:CBS domain-containing protein n=1 Tax=Thalassorhabdus alkalitolerans TaxID=2282697 RepID=A0ABW0YQ71_9BACI